jgi:hypothetical protein
MDCLIAHAAVVVVRAYMAASRIAASSKVSRVTVLEKNGLLVDGAILRCCNVGKVLFDTNVTQFTLLPDVYRDLFRDCEEVCPFEMDSVHQLIRVIFDDMIASTCQQNEAMTTIPFFGRITARKWMPLNLDGATKMDRLRQHVRLFFDCGLPNFIGRRTFRY